MTTDTPLENIQLKDEDSTGTQALKAVPVVGSGAKAIEAVTGANDDGEATFGDVSSIASESTGLVQSCMDVAGAVNDPLSWLVGKGLDFLLAVCQPLQDALHFVSGDGPALAAAAESFSNIGKALDEFGRNFEQEAKDALSEWHGLAAEAAGTRFGEFANGVSGTAAEAGSIAQLLQISSMIMTVIEDFLKALITELVTWLISIWIPALAAAAPTFGASTAAAGAATGVRAATTASRATRQVSRLQRLLEMVKDLLTKLKTVFGGLRNKVAATKVGEGFRNATAQRQQTGFFASMGSALGDEARAQAGYSLNEQGKPRPTPGKPAGTLDNARKAHDYGDVGTEQSMDEISRQLDF
ncbi:hypothetical protein [Saccharomonospora saliphila]|uniref:hypothetical protein n=1 Tax=Saccharomonospora saliphila TaxID=369829 RepID=UPI0003700BA1|nr:hypothetical protein [Saccharomonospora saliphila]